MAQAKTSGRTSRAKTSKVWKLTVLVETSRPLTRTEVREAFDDVIGLGMGENMNSPIGFARVTNADID